MSISSNNRPNALAKLSENNTQSTHSSRADSRHPDNGAAILHHPGAPGLSDAMARGLLNSSAALSLFDADLQSAPPLACEDSGQRKRSRDGDESHQAAAPAFKRAATDAALAMRESVSQTLTPAARGSADASCGAGAGVRETGLVPVDLDIARSAILLELSADQTAILRKLPAGLRERTLAALDDLVELTGYRNMEAIGALVDAISDAEVRVTLADILSQPREALPDASFENRLGKLADACGLSWPQIEILLGAPENLRESALAELRRLAELTTYGSSRDMAAFLGIVRAPEVREVLSETLKRGIAEERIEQLRKDYDLSAAGASSLEALPPDLLSRTLSGIHRLEELTAYQADRIQMAELLDTVEDLRSAPFFGRRSRTERRAAGEASPVPEVTFSMPA